ACCSRRICASGCLRTISHGSSATPWMSWTCRPSYGPTRPLTGAGSRPIAEFRKRHLPALAALFLQVLRLCRAAGLVTLGHVALDGTKVRANASKHKAMSYARMEETEQRLQAEVRRLLEEAERVDAAEDAEYGRGRR